MWEEQYLETCEGGGLREGLCVCVREKERERARGREGGKGGVGGWRSGGGGVWRGGNDFYLFPTLCMRKCIYTCVCCVGVRARETE